MCPKLEKCVQKLEKCVQKLEKCVQKLEIFSKKIGNLSQKRAKINPDYRLDWIQNPLSLTDSDSNLDSTCSTGWVRFQIH